ncbi:hypothetical protein DOK67_0002303 [Enterococcus sp. DIV0212c]|uniref:bacterial Ig-like domain-containing protein n=1 Tax=Enterococcus sp. DIV0212c TaxID=2230867 RepID=UPI001A9B87C9|nr:bacterial Ig-like domain-containing protein [Enterococcus sp. DIV0212c]MBO1355291.1 bacterial Ig-like domain-containing protein [Enterococcus sp. DIV0212c]
MKKQINKMVLVALLASQVTFAPSVYATDVYEADSNIESIALTMSDRVVQVSGTDSSKKNNFDRFLNENKIKETTEEESKKIASFSQMIDSLAFDQVLEIVGGRKFGIVTGNDASAGENYDLIQLDNSFQEIKMNKELFATRFIQAYPDETIDNINENTKVILLAATYFNRWYNIQLQDENLWEVLMFENQELTKASPHSIEPIVNWINYLKESEKIYSKNVNHSFENNPVFINLENHSYQGLIEWFVQKELHTTDYTTWFREYFNGQIYKDQKMNTRYDVGSWNKKLVNDLPYLLTLKPNTDFVIGELRNETFYTSIENYGEALPEVIGTVGNIIDNYLLTVERTEENPEQDLIEVGERFIKDRVGDTNDILGSTSDLAKYYLYDHQLKLLDGSAAVAGNGTIQFQSYKANKYSTLAHEFTHEMNFMFYADSEFFSTYQNRRGNAAFIDIYGTYNDGNEKEREYTNKSAERFQNKQDLIDYSSRYESLIYAMDAAIAESVLTLPIEEQAQYIEKVNIDVDKGYFIKDGVVIDDKGDKSATSNKISLDDLRKLNIKTIDDLIDNGMMIVEPTDNSKTKAFSNYGSSLTHADFFLHQGKNIHHNQRMINTMFAYDGWEGFKNYNLAIRESGSMENSIEGLRKTFNDSTLTYRSLLKQNYHTNLEKAENEGLKDQSFDELKETVKRNLPNFYSIKKSMAKKYLNLTDEFRTDIFGEDANLSHEVTSYDELIEAMLNYPNDKIIVKQHLKAQGQYKDTVVPVFTGRLFGEGHKITGLTHPLIEKAEGAQITSLILDQVSIVGYGEEDAGLGALSRILLKTSVKDIHVKGSISTDDPVEVGGITGIAIASRIEESSVNVVLSGRDTGGIVGRSEQASTMENVYTLGEITKGRRIGGLVGNGFNSSNLTNAYSAMKITALKASDAGGVFGTSYSYGDVTFNLTNTLSLGDVHTKNGVKVQREYLNGTNQNNYELEAAKGLSSVGIPELDVKVASTEQVQQPDFYKNTLKWDTEKVWDVDTVDKETPFLRNSDPRNIKKILIELTDTTIYEGDKWEAKDNFVSATNQEGNPIEWKDIKVGGTVNTAKAGTYKLTYSYGGLSKTATVTVKENLATIEAKDSTIYVGDRWEAKDNFLSAIDKAGNPVDFSIVRVEKSIDVNKPGKYPIIYSIDGATKTITVTVLENQAEILAKDSQINVGDKWEAKDNFISAKDKTGKTVDFDALQVEGTVNSHIQGTYKITYTMDDISTSIIVTVVGDTTKPNDNNTNDSKSQSNEEGNKQSKNTKKPQSNKKNALPNTGEQQNNLFILIGLALLVITFAKKMKKIIYKN